MKAATDPLHFFTLQNGKKKQKASTYGLHSLQMNSRCLIFARHRSVTPADNQALCFINIKHNHEAQTLMNTSHKDDNLNIVQLTFTCSAQSQCSVLCCFN